MATGGHQTNRREISFDQASTRLLKKVVDALEKPTPIVVNCDHTVKPSPHALDIVIAVMRGMDIPDDKIQFMTAKMFEQGVYFILDPDFNDQYIIRSEGPAI